MPTERRRANRIVTKLLVAQIAATVALLIAVWALQAQTKQSIRDSESAVRAQQTDQLVAGCARGVQRDFESYATNRDLAGFARDAEAARRAEGRFDLAARYAKRARDAEMRVVSVGARLPAHEDAASIQAFCRVLYPPPR